MKWLCGLIGRKWEYFQPISWLLMAVGAASGVVVCNYVFAHPHRTWYVWLTVAFVTLIMGVPMYWLSNRGERNSRIDLHIEIEFFPKDGSDT